MMRRTGWRIAAVALLAAVCTTAAAHISFAQVKSVTADPWPIIAADARTLPVLARHGMAASQEARASQIGVDVLRRGGNAVDAAVAVGFALAVTLPRAGNLGGGGFMLVHLAKQKKTIAIDYRETAPADTPVNVFLNESGDFVPERSQSSGLGVGVPGTVAGLALAHRKYGSGKLSLAQLIAPAITLARDGFLIEDDLADSLPQATRRLGRYPSSRAIFLHADGRPMGRGDRLVQRDLSQALERIAKRGEAGFYEGETASKLVASVRAYGGRMTMEDLKSYQVVEREPVRGTYRGRDIVSMPPPSSGGVHLIELLNILEAWPIADLGHNSAETVHLMAEAMKHVYADRSEHMGDPDFVKMPLKGLLSKSYANLLREQISRDKAKPSIEIKAANPAPYESDQTTHYSVVDQDGNAVANTYTLNFSYGLGLVADGTGILLNNELDDFAAKTGVMNAYGLLGGAANAPAPRKRPLSSMTPTLVFKDGELEIVTGSPGGSRIITIVLQIIMNIVDHRMNAAEASEAARIHHQWQPDELRVERGLSVDTIRLLEGKGHNVRIGSTFGSAQTIYRAGGLLMGASDSRQRGGAAAGY